MGANFGDIDNDGYLDIYLGTGNPSYASMLPNVLLHNKEGKFFTDVTASSGTGELHKGHGVAFADIDNDGDEDLLDGDRRRGARRQPRFSPVRKSRQRQRLDQPSPRRRENKPRGHRRPHQSDGARRRTSRRDSFFEPLAAEDRSALPRSHSTSDLENRPASSTWKSIGPSAKRPSTSRTSRPISFSRSRNLRRSMRN